MKGAVPRGGGSDSDEGGEEAVGAYYPPILAGAAPADTVPPAGDQLAVEIPTQELTGQPLISLLDKVQGQHISDVHKSWIVHVICSLANRVAVEGNAALRCKATGVGLL
ncbi:hypothetical protein C2E20_8913 [Micractinium conductrix]|uniref:Uncharacterized protein n=1 Tax=Micractinium conductrix TaxID=554055 RepID=A0A2P6UZZ9_9CHLO|nr:hypothetical protein C2E20_8913 [Micractinium conductrix]|eukprot:PSC67412.1 hypothetical protein C2E20_8913 [Micractinium conductrix]